VRAVRVVLGVLLLSAVAVQCHAQQAFCGPRAEVLKQLADRYHEAPIALGVGTNGRVLEILSSPDGSTWTALTVGTDGTACVVMSGEQWTGILKGRGA
jgi:hypothetical protein